MTQICGLLMLVKILRKKSLCLGADELTKKILTIINILAMVLDLMWVDVFRCLMVVGLVQIRAICAY